MSLSSQPIIVGTTFESNSQWHSDELDLIKTVAQQISQQFTGVNLLVNMTWFGPQFDNGQYERLHTITADRVFFLAAVDPVMLNADQLADIVQQVQAQEAYYIGNFETPQQFSFIATLLPKYFKQYTPAELNLDSAQYRYVCYNRKPRQHRVDLVRALIDNNLDKCGLITLGKDISGIYSNRAPVITLGEQPDDYAGTGNWGHSMAFGIPHDIHTLGNPDIWRNHFLHIISETEFNPWDPMFITEKTWKPILGLRPFVINGQTKIYQYLRDNGFKTFNHYFDVDLEVNELEVHSRIVDVVKYLSTLSDQDILDMYQTMLPDLLHNQQRFYQYAAEQQHRLGNLFT